MNIDAIVVYIVFRVNGIHVVSPSNQSKNIAAFQSVHHVSQFTMSVLFCVILFYMIFLPLYFPLSEFVNTGGTI